MNESTKGRGARVSATPHESTDVQREDVTPEQRMFDFGMQRYGERLASIVANLHDLADEVEREARVRPEADVMGTPALIWSAQTVVHRIMWGLANLNLDGLVNVAGDTEAARNRLPDIGRHLAGEEPGDARS